ncbi:MAG: DNA-formamidopyrimidine glycosylase family protein [Nannocystaceae bacterium]
MPELPEVERARRLIEQVAVGRTIERVRCDEDEIVFAGVAPRTVARRLRGRTVVASRRRGKQMWWELDQRPWPLFHFGMTGQFVTPGQGPLRLAASGRKALDRSWPPKFWKIHLWLDDGTELAMTNARRLGRIRLQDDPEHEPPIATLGFDPLYEMPPVADFAARLRARRGQLKAVLLDQGFAAGVGNWMADEILYQARIDPRRRGTELSDPEARRVHAKLRAIVNKACAVDADKARFPPGWLFHHRWGKDAQARTAAGEVIEHLEIGGRTTAWVPAVQK